MLGNEIQSKTDFLKALNFLRKKLDSLCPGHKEDPPPLHTKAFVRFDFKIG